MALTFEAEGHKYFLDGVRIPSVTQVLEGVGLSDFSMVPENILKEARDRGTRVHQICELWDNANLSLIGMDQEDEDYLKQWKKFKLKNDIKSFEANEERIYSPTHLYGGTPDRLFLKGNQFTIFDIKTGVRLKSHGYQMAAYARIVREKRKFPHSKKIKRVGVYLKPNGFETLEYRDRSDWNVFLSALNIYKIKKENHNV